MYKENMLYTYFILFQKIFLLFCLKVSIKDLERDKWLMIWILNQCCILEKYDLLLSVNHTDNLEMSRKFIFLFIHITNDI